MRQQSERIKRFCSRWESRIPDVAVIRAVYGTFPELKSLRAPIDPFRIATSRNVQIIAADIRHDGVLSRSESGGYLIELNNAHSETRRRFTVAHELGHVLFLDVEQPTPDSRFRLAEAHVHTINVDREEERLCNIAAAELLMPSTYFSSRIRLDSVGDNVFALAREFKTSVHATALRLTTLSPQKLAICLWEYSARLDAFSTRWIAQRGRLPAQLYVTRDQPVFDEFSAGVRFKGRRWMSFGGPLDDYEIEAIPLPQKRVLMVITFSPMASGDRSTPEKRSASSESLF
jgi:hypothetical protein